MVRAGFKKVFVGIETPLTESLEGCRKIQNSSRDLMQTVRTLQKEGLEVMGGFIVGFDQDRNDVSKRQFKSIQNSGVVTAMVGLLTALPQTRLYQRLLREGRLESETTGNNTQAILNFKPILNRDYLVNGYRELMKNLYEPRTYYQRARIFLRNHEMRGPKLRLAGSDLKAFFRSFWTLGIRKRGRMAFWRYFWITLFARAGQFRWAIELAIIGTTFVSWQTPCSSVASFLRTFMGLSPHSRSRGSP